MINNFKIQLDELEFHGLIFSKSKKYKNYPKDYWDKLIDDGSHYSEIKYLESIDEQMIELIHLKLSYYYLFVAFSLLTFSFSIILFFQKYLLLSIILISLSVILYFISWLFLRSARNEHSSMTMNKTLINGVFEQHRQEKKEKEDKEINEK